MLHIPQRTPTAVTAGERPGEGEEEADMAAEEAGMAVARMTGAEAAGSVGVVVAAAGKEVTAVAARGAANMDRTETDEEDMVGGGTIEVTIVGDREDMEVGEMIVVEADAEEGDLAVGVMIAMEAGVEVVGMEAGAMIELAVVFAVDARTVMEGTVEVVVEVLVEAGVATLAILEAVEATIPQTKCSRITRYLCKDCRATPMKTTLASFSGQ